MLSIIILLVFTLMLISLFIGLYFLFSNKQSKQISDQSPVSSSEEHNQNNDSMDPLLKSLSLRVTLALVLLLLLIIGFLNGNLRNHAPWSAMSPKTMSPQKMPSQYINENKEP
ncbi:DUF2909 family protein [Marinomonas agarivorans]|nr:DUF2909 family protein [Marinomonas agarivorans]